MIDKKSLKDIIFSGIDEINEFKSTKDKISKSLETNLSKSLDSLELINLIVAIEDKLQDELNIEIILSDEETMNEEDNPFESVKKLIEYITTRVAKNNE